MSFWKKLKFNDWSIDTIMYNFLQVQFSYWKRRIIVIKEECLEACFLELKPSYFVPWLWYVQLVLQDKRSISSCHTILRITAAGRNLFCNKELIWKSDDTIYRHSQPRNHCKNATQIWRMIKSSEMLIEIFDKKVCILVNYSSCRSWWQRDRTGLNFGW